MDIFLKLKQNGLPQKFPAPSLLDFQSHELFLDKLTGSSVQVEKMVDGQYLKVESTYDFLMGINEHCREKFLIKGFESNFPDTSKFIQAISRSHDLFMNPFLYFDYQMPMAFEAKVIATNNFVQDLVGGGKWIFPKIDGDYIKDFSRFHGKPNYINKHIDSIEKETIITDKGDWIYLPAGICVFQTKTTLPPLVQFFLSEPIVSYSEVIDHLGIFLASEQDDYLALTKDSALKYFGDSKLDLNEIEHSLSAFFARRKLLKFKNANKQGNPSV